MEGVLNIDKPAGPSSARVVSQIKRLLPRGTKIGHGGTLDPFATGVLILLIGRATCSCERLMDEPKQYEATLKSGARSGDASKKWKFKRDNSEFHFPRLACLSRVREELNSELFRLSAPVYLLH